ncbi:hypothetical protein COB64_02110 [Candidatus Wolfebacteria bacterium]|nr:MAG: hypothetical protein COB64_02110 [Candidatus Wolfebacteria bacterium]
MIILIVALFIYGYYLKKSNNSPKKIFKAILFLLLITIPLRIISIKVAPLFDDGNIAVVFFFVIPALISALVPLIAYDRRWFNINVNEKTVLTEVGQEKKRLPKWLKYLLITIGVVILAFIGFIALIAFIVATSF